MELLYLAVKETHAENPDCHMRLAWHPGWNKWYCIDCGLAIVVRAVPVEETVKDLTAGLLLTKNIPGRGLVLDIDLDQVYAINAVYSDDIIKVNDTYYEIQSIEYQLAGTKRATRIGLVVKEVPV